MGSSSSTLSIIAAINQPSSSGSDRQPPVPRIAADINSDTWDYLIDYFEDQNDSLHKLLETYEFVETEHLFLDSAAGPAVDHEIKNDANHVVLFITSMRGIRKTYNDCRAINTILDGFRVAVDKKDIAMNLIHRTELQRLLGKPMITLPQLFIGAEHVGGVDEVRELYETGELRKLLEGCRVKGLSLVDCVCGDVRFVVCSQCSGSKKVFHEQNKKSSECGQCNENGLVKCPACNG